MRNIAWFMVAIFLFSIPFEMIDYNHKALNDSILENNDDEMLTGSNTPSIAINVPQVHHYYRGGTWAYIGAYDLTVGESYEIAWELTTRSGVRIDRGTHAWTQNSGTTYNGLANNGIEFSNPPLDLDDYCMLGALYDSNSGQKLYSDSFCFTIIYSGDLYIFGENHNGDYDFYFGDTIDIVVSGSQLASNVTYFANYSITNEDGYEIYGGTTSNWTNIAPPAMGWYYNESRITLSRLGVGNYCVDGELFVSDGSSLAVHNYCFQILTPVTPTGNLSINTESNFEDMTYYVGDVIEIEMIADNLIEENYEIHWRLIYEDGVEIMAGSEEIEYWNSPYWADEIWLVDSQTIQRFNQPSDFAEGDYCIEANLTLSETQLIVDNSSSCFEIVAVGDVTIELEQGENILVGRCDDFPEIEDQETCENSGGSWQEWEWGWLEKTEYVVGEDIQWNINIDNLSYTDYELSWAVYNETNVVLAFDSFVFNTNDYLSIIEVTNYGLQCGLTDPFEGNCWYWSDFLIGGGEFWDTGNYCFEVTLTLANGGDFSSSDQVCHDVYATGDIYIELTEEEPMMVGGCPDAPWISEQWECEEMGYDWVEEFEMGIGTKTQYEIGELVTWDIQIHNSSYTDYILSWDLTDGEGLSLANDSFNWNPYDSNPMPVNNNWGFLYQFEVDNENCQWDLNSVDEYQCWNWYDKFIDDNDFYSAGTYCFEVSITLANGDDFSSSDQVCHDVYATGDIYIELTEEEPMMVGGCPDAPWISEQWECEEVGYDWVEEFEMGMGTKTQYEIGELVSWDIKIQNASYTDYILSWDLTDGDGLSLANDSFNWSQYNSNVMSEYNFWGEVHVFEVDNGDCQWDLNSVDEYQCWNWYDKFIDDNDFYSAGTYCFEVSITLANGDDFSSSDQVCHDVYATGDIYIELTEEEPMMVGGCPDAPWISEQWECEEIYGEEWVEEFEMGMGTKTQYEIGELVSWDIKIQNASYTEYILSWDLNDGDGLSLANDSFILDPYFGYGIGSDYWGSYELIMVDSIYCQWQLKSPYENECWNWVEDHNVNFSNSGKYCLEVTLTLEEGGAFSSSDEVCHYVLTEDGMIIDNSSPWNDSDNDGVIDELDECPDTMENEFTDKTGCSINQIEGGSEDTPGFGLISVLVALLSAIIITGRRET